MYVKGEQQLPKNRVCKKNETVKMSVDGNKIQWSVGESIRAQLIHPMIGDASISWVPFIRMYHAGDTILW